MLNILPALLMMLLYGPSQSEGVNPLLRAEVIRIVLQSELYEQRQVIATIAPVSDSVKSEFENSELQPVLDLANSASPEAVFAESLRPRDGPAR
jgi:hypothetical protein